MEGSVVALKENRDRSKSKETTIQYPLPSKKSELFQLFFLAHDQHQTVEFVEVENVNFTEVIQRLKQGESVFITYKSTETWRPSLRTKKGKKEHWYITHF